MIEKYVGAPAFQETFLRSEQDDRGTHGPFLADRIKPSDFVPLEESGLEHYLESVNLSLTPGEDEAERAKILPHLRKAFAEGGRCYILKVDERNKDLFHDLGWVLTLFREFLFVFPERDRLERFVIGYD
ncbi:MAG: hypothetical protein ABSA47_13365 [Verrucomicrobiota bacterium]